MLTVSIDSVELRCNTIICIQVRFVFSKPKVSKTETETETSLNQSFRSFALLFSLRTTNEKILQWCLPFSVSYLSYLRSYSFWSCTRCTKIIWWQRMILETYSLEELGRISSLLQEIKTWLMSSMVKINMLIGRMPLLRLFLRQRFLTPLTPSSSLTMMPSSMKKCFRTLSLQFLRIFLLINLKIDFWH